MKISQYAQEIQDLLQEAENDRNATMDYFDPPHESLRAVSFLAGKIYAYRRMLGILEALIDKERR